MSQKVTSGFPQFREKDGSPLENGYVYVGTAGLSAPTNQITVYWDRANTIVAAQPIRTSGGFLMQDGTPGRIYSPVSDYSLSVQDKLTTEVYSNLNAGADDAVTGITNLSLSQTATTVTVESDTGTNATIPQAAAGGNAGVMSGADKTKLDGIEAGATGDQTAAEIKTAYESNADTNAFTDAEKASVATIGASNSELFTIRNNATELSAAQPLESPLIGTRIDVTAGTDYSEAEFQIEIKTTMEDDVGTASGGQRYVHLATITKANGGEPYAVLNCGQLVAATTDDDNWHGNNGALATSGAFVESVGQVGTSKTFRVTRIDSSNELCFKTTVQDQNTGRDWEIECVLSGIRKYAGTDVDSGSSGTIMLQTSLT
jgi:hypothetical protein